MSTATHPDLTALSARYKQLYDDATAGHISGADALAALAGLSVTDGTGAVWQINPEGNFVRAQFLGAPAVQADPAGYVGPETVHSNPEIGAFDVGTHQQPTSPSWDNGPATTAPTGFGAGSPFGGGAPAARDSGTAHSPGLGHATGAAPASQGFGGTGEEFSSVSQGDPFAAAATQLGNPVSEPPARSLFAREEQHARGPRNLTSSGPGLFLARNKILVAIVVVGLALLGYAFTQKKDAGSSTLPSSTVEDPSFPAPTAALPTDTSTPAASALPGPADQRRVLAALTSGDRKTIQSVVNTPAAPAELAHSAAFFAGLDKTGLAITSGPAAAQAAGAVQTWSIKDGTSTVLSVKVAWVSDAGTWKLTTVPLP